MARRAFPFIDDNFDRTEYPNEVKPTADNPKMPLFPAKPNLAEGYTRSGQKFAERFAEAHNIGRDASEHITTADVDSSLIRLFEAADAAPNANVTNLSAGSLKSLSTGLGDLLYVEVELSPLALCPDPMNGRTIVSARDHRLQHLTAVDDHRLGLPVLDVPSAETLTKMVDQSRNDLGFNNAVVAPGKDYQDIVSVGLQGVHQPLLVTPTIYRTPDGNFTVVLKLDDGNRRHSMTQRVLLEASGQSTWSAVSAWDDHFANADGTLTLRPTDIAAANAVRTKGLFNDFSGGVMYPSSGRSDDIDFFLANNAARSIKLRTLLRTRTVRVRLVLGVNTATLAPEAITSPSATATIVSEAVRSLHIMEAAQKPWSAETQNLQCALLALSNVRRKIDAGADDAPITSIEAQAVIDNTITDWVGATDGVDHPLRLVAKTIATLVCDDHDATQPVKDAMRTMSVSLHYSSIAENRAKIAAEVVMSPLGFSRAENRAYDRARSVIDRAIRTRLFTDVKSHPEGTTTPFWTLLGLPVTALVLGAKREVAAVNAMNDDDRLTAGAGTGWYGPNIRSLLLLALLAQTTNPAVAAYAGRVGASPFQLTVNGLGGSRGITMTTPDQVLIKLCGDQIGIDQLGEIVSAALETQPRLPRNVIDPDAEDANDPSTRGLLTETFLRGEKMGWLADGDTGRPDTGTAGIRDPHEQYRKVVADMIDRIHQAFELSRQLERAADNDGPETEGAETLRTLFEDTGITSNPAQPVKDWLSSLQQLFFAGEANARRSRT